MVYKAPNSKTSKNVVYPYFKVSKFRVDAITKEVEAECCSVTFERFINAFRFVRDNQVADKHFHDKHTFKYSISECLSKARKHEATIGKFNFKSNEMDYAKLDHFSADEGQFDAKYYSTISSL